VSPASSLHMRVGLCEENGCRGPRRGASVTNALRRLRVVLCRGNVWICGESLRAGGQFNWGRLCRWQSELLWCASCLCDCATRVCVLPRTVLSAAFAALCSKSCRGPAAGCNSREKRSRRAERRAERVPFIVIHEHVFPVPLDSTYQLPASCAARRLCWATLECEGSCSCRD
jgi:hypothetical protein